jgi:hypothetical protein
LAKKTILKKESISMKNFKSIANLSASIALTLPIFAASALSAQTEDSTSTLSPSWTSPNNFPGKTDYGYDYSADAPSEVQIQIEKNNATQNVVSASGSFSLTGKAAQILFEQMISPVSEHNSPGNMMIPPSDSRNGEGYFCTKMTFSVGVVKYTCTINLDVRSGAIRDPNHLGIDSAVAPAQTSDQDPRPVVESNSTAKEGERVEIAPSSNPQGTSAAH